jgi:hypothetical protein
LASPDLFTSPAMRNAVAASCPLVPESGMTDEIRDLHRVRIAITRSEQGTPVLHAVTAVTPAGPASIEVTKKGETGSWVGSGASGAEFMAMDAVTDEAIADNPLHPAVYDSKEEIGGSGRRRICHHLDRANQG